MCAYMAVGMHICTFVYVCMHVIARQTTCMLRPCWDSHCSHEGLHVAIRSSTDWMRPTYILQDNWLSQFSNLTISLMQIPSRMYLDIIFKQACDHCVTP